MGTVVAVVAVVFAAVVIDVAKGPAAAVVVVAYELTDFVTAAVHLGCSRHVV